MRLADTRADRVLLQPHLNDTQAGCHASVAEAARRPRAVQYGDTIRTGASRGHRERRSLGEEVRIVLFPCGSFGVFGGWSRSRTRTM